MNNVALSKRDILLLIGTCLAPMTGFRIWKVGPGEIICLLYCIVNYKRLRIIKINDAFVRFWIWFLVCISIGTIWGMYRYPDETIESDMVIWVYLAIISTCIHLVLQYLSYERIKLILIAIAHCTSIWYFMLFLYSKTVSNSFLGAPLWYNHVRFSGGGTNPHQIALLLSLGIVIQTWLIIQNSGLKSKILPTALLLVTVFLLQQTKSSTAIMAVIVGALIVIWQNMWVRYKYKRSLLIVAMIGTIIIVVLFGTKFYDYFMLWVASDANGMDRIDIFSSFPVAFSKGPIFGLGPGIHARNGYKEFHNTYLEICAMGGITGIVVFFLFSFRLFKESLKNPVSLGVLVTCYIYGLAGFGARRLVYWIIVVLGYSFACNTVDRNRDGL